MLKLTGALCEEELSDLLNEKISELDGEINIYLDGEYMYSSTITNGVERLPASAPGDYPCTYEGVRQCTRDAIDNMSTIPKIICIIEGPTCVGVQLATCAYDNCGGYQL